MNYRSKLRIEDSNQRSYLDDLSQGLSAISEGIRDFDGCFWKRGKKVFAKKGNIIPIILKNFQISL